MAAHVMLASNTSTGPTLALSVTHSTTTNNYATESIIDDNIRIYDATRKQSTS